MSLRPSSVDRKGVERLSIHGPGPPSSKTLNVQSQIRHDRNYKLIQDTLLGGKETIRRYDGHIPGHPKYDVKLPLSDPRPIHLQFKYIADLDLVVPLFTIDNNIIATPPKREVSIFDLNDNVNKTFLEQMASKMGVVDDLMVFYHPYNRKHLGIGMVVFHTSSDATKFVTQFNGKPVMGSIINCCLDPYFAYLSKRYEGQTGTECPTPIHLRGLDERFLLLKRNEICMANTGGAMEKILPSKEGCEENADMDMESPSSQPRGNVQVGPDVETSTPSPRCITSLGPVPITSLHSRTPQVAALTQSSEIRQDRSYIRPQFSQLAIPPATIPYLPPPPYSMSLPCSGFPPSYDTAEPLLDDIASSSRRGRTPPDEKNKDRRRSLSHERSRSKDRGRDHRRKRKRRRRGSSQSSSSDSNSSLNSGEYLRVEKKEKSLKYISRERKGREKTIVQEIKTVTKKYKRTEAKRNESRATSGLQEISSDESTEEERIPRKKSHKSDKNIEKKCDGHRWSSTSSDSEERKKTRRTDKRDHLRRDSTRQLPGFEMGTTTPSYLGSSEFTNTQSAGLATSNFPPPNYHVATPPIGYTAFNPHLPPPSINPSLQCSNFNHAISKSPAVALRFVEASPPRAHQSLEDRVASLFGKKTESKVFGSQENLRTIPHISEVYSSRNNCCDETEDMDVEVDSDISPESEEQRKIRLEKEREFEQRRMKSLSLEVCAQVRADLRKELRDVLVKDLHKKIEIAAFEAMEGAWLRRRTEIEEKKRNQARENLRAELAVNVNNNSSQKSDSFPVIQQTSSSNLDITKFREELHSPEKLANIPGFGSIFSMPRLPSFRRKIRPPSPKCMESSRSESASDASGDDSDVAHKSTTASQATDSSDDLVLVKRRKRTRTRSLDSSGECSSSSHNESESEKCSDVVSTTAVEKNESTRSKTSTSISLSTTDSEESEVQEDSVVITDQPMFSDVSCSSVALKPSDIPTIDELLEWHESIPRSSYHIHYTEHCYASTLLTPEKQIENSVSTIMKKTRKQIVQSVVKRPPAKKISSKGKPIAVRKGKRIETELTSLLPPSIIVREKRLDVSSSTFFPKRSPYDQRNILYGWESGFDIEDQNYLREAWANLQPVGGPLPPWRRCIPFNSVSWEVTPKLLDRPSRIGRLDIYYDDPELEGIAPHDKGCARAQGYYKLSVKEKRRLIRRPEEGHQDKTDISERDETAVRHHVQANKESRSMHRRLLTTMGDTNTDFFKVNQLKYRKKMIKFARSRIHGWGLYALEPIAPDDMIVEYVGQKVRPTVADEREKAYERRGIGSSYLFRIDDTCVIDATKMGNFARFINHSCQPNCYAKVVTVDGDRRIVIYSKTLINKGDEITYDYKFPIEDDKIDCLCGAPNCRGTLN